MQRYVASVTLPLRCSYVAVFYIYIKGHKK